MFKNPQPTKMLSEEEIKQFKNTLVDIDESIISTNDIYKWSRLKDAIDFLRIKNPTIQEINKNKSIMSTRTMQRTYGGLMYIRKIAGLESDLRKTQERKKTAIKINKRAIKLETKFYKDLVQLFGERNVVREYCISDDSKHRSDFMIYIDKNDDSKKCIIDVFFPSTRESLGGCVNIKKKKYNNSLHKEREKSEKILFINLNPNIHADNYRFVDDMPWAQVMNENTFWQDIKNIVQY